MCTSCNDIPPAENPSNSVSAESSPLTEEEFQKMKEHTIIGERVLGEMIKRTPVYAYLGLAKEIAISHHERFDGKGYPDGLEGKNIPFGSRIIAVADSIDAMISDRPYRKGMCENVCREHGFFSQSVSQSINLK